jgi:hypothetical protein
MRRMMGQTRNPISGRENMGMTKILMENIECAVLRLI